MRLRLSARAQTGAAARFALCLPTTWWANGRQTRVSTCDERRQTARRHQETIERRKGDDFMEDFAAPEYSYEQQQQGQIGSIALPLSLRATAYTRQQQLHVHTVAAKGGETR